MDLNSKDQDLHSWNQARKRMRLFILHAALASATSFLGTIKFKHHESPCFKEQPAERASQITQ